MQSGQLNQPKESIDIKFINELQQWLKDHNNSPMQIIIPICTGNAKDLSPERFSALVDVVHKFKKEIVDPNNNNSNVIFKFVNYKNEDNLEGVKKFGNENQETIKKLLERNEWIDSKDWRNLDVNNRGLAKQALADYKSKDANFNNTYINNKLTKDANNYFQRVFGKDANQPVGENKVKKLDAIKNHIEEEVIDVLSTMHRLDGSQSMATAWCYPNKFYEAMDYVCEKADKMGYEVDSMRHQRYEFLDSHHKNTSSLPLPDQSVFGSTAQQFLLMSYSPNLDPKLAVITKLAIDEALPLLQKANTDPNVIGLILGSMITRIWSAPSSPQMGAPGSPEIVRPTPINPIKKSPSIENFSPQQKSQTPPPSQRVGFN